MDLKNEVDKPIHTKISMFITYVQNGLIISYRQSCVYNGLIIMKQKGVTVQSNNRKHNIIYLF